MKRLSFSLLLVAYLTQQGCTHRVMEDYPEYLKNNANTLNLPQTDVNLTYQMDTKALEHEQEIRSFMAGYANNWVIEFGAMMEATLQSDDVKKGFKSIAKENPNADIELRIGVVNFNFDEMRAEIEYTVTITNLQDKKSVTKTYKGTGQPQGGKMFWAGALGMKNAIQQSTKLGMDPLLKQMVLDIQSVLGKKAVPRS